jgi:hypothetical protein
MPLKHRRCRENPISLRRTLPRGKQLRGGACWLGVVGNRLGVCEGQIDADGQHACSERLRPQRDGQLDAKRLLRWKSGEPQRFSRAEHDRKRRRCLGERHNPCRDGQRIAHRVRSRQRLFGRQRRDHRQHRHAGSVGQRRGSGQDRRRCDRLRETGRHLLRVCERERSRQPVERRRNGRGECQLDHQRAAADSRCSTPPAAGAKARTSSQPSAARSPDTRPSRAPPGGPLWRWLGRVLGEPSGLRLDGGRA